MKSLKIGRHPTEDDYSLFIFQIATSRFAENKETYVGGGKEGAKAW